MNRFRHRKLRRLVQAKIDGRITSIQEMELNHLLSLSGVRRDDFDRLMSVERELNHSKVEEEHIDVSTRVMQAVLNKAKIKEKSPFSLNTQAWIFGVPAMRFAAVMLVGILLGSALTWVLMDDRSGMNKDQLRGSMMNNEMQGISFMKQNTVIKVIPYALDNMYYLNFIIESQEEIQINIGYDDLDFVPRKSDFIELQGARTINTGNGSISFAARGRATALLILEKVSDVRAPITVRAEQNNGYLFHKQLFFN